MMSYTLSAYSYMMSYTLTFYIYMMFYTLTSYIYTMSYTLIPCVLYMTRCKINLTLQSQKPPIFKVKANIIAFIKTKILRPVLSVKNPPF